VRRPVQAAGSLAIRSLALRDKLRRSTDFPGCQFSQPCPRRAGSSDALARAERPGPGVAPVRSSERLGYTAEVEINLPACFRSVLGRRSVVLGLRQGHDGAHDEEGDDSECDHCDLEFVLLLDAGSIVLERIEVSVSDHFPGTYNFDPDISLLTYLNKTKYTALQSIYPGLS
jgi:hypothetical protein